MVLQAIFPSAFGLKKEGGRLLEGALNTENTVVTTSCSDARSHLKPSDAVPPLSADGLYFHALPVHLFPATSPQVCGIWNRLTTQWPRLWVSNRSLFLFFLSLLHSYTLNLMSPIFTALLTLSFMDSLTADVGRTVHACTH